MEQHPGVEGAEGTGMPTGPAQGGEQVATPSLGLSGCGLLLLALYGAGSLVLDLVGLIR